MKDVRLINESLVKLELCESFPYSANPPLLYLKHKVDFALMESSSQIREIERFIRMCVQLDMIGYAV